MQLCKRDALWSRNVLRHSRQQLGEQNRTFISVREILVSHAAGPPSHAEPLSSRIPAQRCVGRARCYFCRERLALEASGEPELPVGGLSCSSLGDVSSCCEEVASELEAAAAAALPPTVGPSGIYENSTWAPEETAYVTRPERKVRRRKTYRERGMPVYKSKVIPAPPRKSSDTWFERHTEDPQKDSALLTKSLAEFGASSHNEGYEVSVTRERTLTNDPPSPTAAFAASAEAGKNPYEAAAMTFWEDFMDDAAGLPEGNTRKWDTRVLDGRSPLMESESRSSVGSQKGATALHAVAEVSFALVGTSLPPPPPPPCSVHQTLLNPPPPPTSSLPLCSTLRGDEIPAPPPPPAPTETWPSESVPTATMFFGSAGGSIARDGNQDDAASASMQQSSLAFKVAVFQWTQLVQRILRRPLADAVSQVSAWRHWVTSIQQSSRESVRKIVPPTITVHQPDVIMVRKPVAVRGSSVSEAKGHVGAQAVTSSVLFTTKSISPSASPSGSEANSITFL